MKSYKHMHQQMKEVTKRRISAWNSCNMLWAVRTNVTCSLLWARKTRRYKIFCSRYKIFCISVNRHLLTPTHPATKRWASLLRYVKQ